MLPFRRGEVGAVLVVPFMGVAAEGAGEACGVFAFLFLVGALLSCLYPFGTMAVRDGNSGLIL